MRIGHSIIPRMCVPALLKGKMLLFDLANLRDQWSIICSLPPFGFGEAIALNQYHRTVQKEGAQLLGMLPFTNPFLDTPLPKTKILRIPLITDPLQRLCRFFGLTEKSSPNRCQSYILDPQGVVRYHLIHQLSWRGLSFLIEILNYCQDQSPLPIGPPLGIRMVANTPVLS